MHYDFKEQLRIGQEQEALLDGYFSSNFRLRPATSAEQRSGIDRWLLHNSGDYPEYAVEYKADFKASETGNAYIETVSVGKYNDDGQFVVSRPGWAYTTSAHVLVYLVVGPGDIYIVRPARIRDSLESWGRYRSVQVKNSGYQGRGLLVPLGELEQIASRVSKLGE